VKGRQGGEAARAEKPLGVLREVVPRIVIQRQLGQSNLGITSAYLQGIDSGEIIETVHTRRAPMIPSAPRYGSDRLRARRCSSREAARSRAATSTLP
jgi:hypothetical protein